MAKQSGNVFKDKKRRLFGFKDTRDLKKERASRIFKTTALSGNGKALAGEPGAEQVEVRHCSGVNFSCVFIINLAFFYIVDCLVSLFCVLVNLAVADAGKASGAFQPGTEPANTGKHIKEPDILCRHSKPPRIISL